MGKDAEDAATKEQRHGHVTAKLLTLAAIAEGFRKGKDIRKLYDWSKERFEAVLDDLEQSGYITRAREEGDKAKDTVLEITEQGRDQLPLLFDELGDATKDFLSEVQHITSKHFKEVVPDIEFNISINKKNTEED